MMMALSIAVLGWGSLIWKPANRAGAPLAAQGVRAGVSADGGSWNVDGPMLPLELARNASNEDGSPYVSWVIVPGAPASSAMWAWLELPPDVGEDVDRALGLAARALATREGAALSRIGRWHRHADPTSFAAGEAIAAWTTAHHMDGVVWTALTPRWFDAERAPTQDEVLGLLRTLVVNQRADHAEEIRASHAGADPQPLSFGDRSRARLARLVASRSIAGRARARGLRARCASMGRRVRRAGGTARTIWA